MHKTSKWFQPIRKIARFISKKIGSSAIAAGILCCSLQQTAAAEETQWKLVLDHTGFGRCSAILSENKILFDDGVSCRLIVPPYDQSIVFCRETKKTMKIPNETFAFKSGINYAGTRVTKIGKEKLFGLDCSRYRVEFPATGAVGEYWATTQLKMHPKLAILCSQMGASPPGYGVPLKMLINKRIGGKEKIYEVLKLEKSNLRAADFVPPKGYTVARDFFELHFGEEGSSYQDTVDSAFIMPNPDKAKKKTTQKFK